MAEMCTSFETIIAPEDVPGSSDIGQVHLPAGRNFSDGIWLMAALALS
jgi:hypothetical protein